MSIGERNMNKGAYLSDYSADMMEGVICTREGFSHELVQFSDCYIGLQRKHILWAKAMLGDKE